MNFSFVFVLIAVSRLNGMFAASTRDIRLVAATASDTSVLDSEDVSCGISGASVKGRIIGGEEAEPHAWPWQVLLECSTGNLLRNCGGSLVSDKWVITASHCMFSNHSKINSENCRVILGKHYFESIENDTAEVKVHLERYFTHEQFNNNLGGFGGYDIALLKLNKTVQFNDYIKPICLPFGLPELQNTSICYATGWGRDDRSTQESAKTLKQLQMPILDAYGNCWLHEHATAPEICAGFNDRDDDVCHGDSGGPLACREDDGKWYLRGVTSYGEINCHKAAIFTKVTGFQEWINEKMASN